MCTMLQEDFGATVMRIGRKEASALGIQPKSGYRDFPAHQ